jgi:hypothetical protein
MSQLGVAIKSENLYHSPNLIRNDNSEIIAPDIDNAQRLRENERLRVSISSILSGEISSEKISNYLQQHVQHSTSFVDKIQYFASPTNAVQNVDSENGIDSGSQIIGLVKVDEFVFEQYPVKDYVRLSLKVCVLGGALVGVAYVYSKLAWYSLSNYLSMQYCFVLISLSLTL